jgi:Uncharacterised BCR, YhbC family COG0779.
VSRLLEVKQLDGKILIGTLLAAGDDSITLEVTSGKGKKAETNQLEIPFSQIKEASVQIKF